MLGSNVGIHTYNFGCLLPLLLPNTLGKEGHSFNSIRKRFASGKCFPFVRHDDLL